MSLRYLTKKYLKELRYFSESLVVRFGLFFFYVIGEKKASDLAAKIAIFVGKKISVNKLAYKNLTNALPKLSESEKIQIIDGMWDNLGRVVGEYPHVANYSPQDLMKKVQINSESFSNIEEMKKSKKGGIIFSGHIGNWEIGPKVFTNFGIKVATVYRPLNNPRVEKMTASIRGTEMISKSSQGNRRIIEVIKQGGFVIILADQKISEGEPVQFFHDKAVTATSIARIALKYGVDVIPARSIRIGKDFRFEVEVDKSLVFEKMNNINDDVINLTTKINQKLESWISQYPAQWFWVHNRWKK
ncbi:MAG: hypothetical protein FJ368_06335 [Pelagibacterales bacterium]|nr:hypothetical protein [Pelagibacterales bacterium]